MAGEWEFFGLGVDTDLADLMTSDGFEGVVGQRGFSSGTLIGFLEIEDTTSPLYYPDSPLGTVGDLTFNHYPDHKPYSIVPTDVIMVPFGTQSVIHKPDLQGHRFLDIVSFQPDGNNYNISATCGTNQNFSFHGSGLDYTSVDETTLTIPPSYDIQLVSTLHIPAGFKANTYLFGKQISVNQDGSRMIVSGASISNGVPDKAFSYKRTLPDGDWVFVEVLYEPYTAYNYLFSNSDYNWTETIEMSDTTLVIASLDTIYVYELVGDDWIFIGHDEVARAGYGFHPHVIISNSGLILVNYHGISRVFVYSIVGSVLTFLTDNDSLYYEFEDIYGMLICELSSEVGLYGISTEGIIDTPKFVLCDYNQTTGVLTVVSTTNPVDNCKKYKSPLGSCDMYGMWKEEEPSESGVLYGDAFTGETLKYKTYITEGAENLDVTIMEPLDSLSSVVEMAVLSPDAIRFVTESGIGVLDSHLLPCGIFYAPPPLIEGDLSEGKFPYVDSYGGRLASPLIVYGAGKMLVGLPDMDVSVLGDSAGCIYFLSYNTTRAIVPNRQSVIISDAISAYGDSTVSSVMTEPANTRVRFNVSIDSGDWQYWDGSDWVNQGSVYIEGMSGCTLDDLNNYLKYIVTPFGASIRFMVTLESLDGIALPTITSISVTSVGYSADGIYDESIKDWEILSVSETQTTMEDLSGVFKYVALKVSI